MSNSVQVIQRELRESSRSRGASLPLRVLVVDDDKDDYFAIERLLKMPFHQEFDVAHCDDFEDAITEARNPIYDIILLDYHIGGSTGIDLIQALGSNLPVPVVMLTGSRPEEFRNLGEQAVEVGAFDILNKNDLSCSALTRSIGFAIKRFEKEKEIRDSESEVRRAQERAEAANFSKSEFLAHLSHEVRTPLNAIVGFSQVLKDDTMGLGMDEKYRDYADTVHRSGLHLLDIINDLLDLSETDSGEYDDRVQRFKRYRTWILDTEEARRAVRRIT